MSIRAAMAIDAARLSVTKARHWGVAARLARDLRQHAWPCAPCGHGANDRKVWRDLWHRLSCTRAGRRELCQVSSAARPRYRPVHAFLVSTGLVALAEIGDKTQILALMLAARFRRPLPIIFGILIATLANHAAAGIVGLLLGNFLTGEWLRWIVGLSFLGMAVWALIPDKYEEDQPALGRGGAFVTTIVVFF